MFIWGLGVHLWPDIHLETRYSPGIWCSLKIGVQLWPNDHLSHGVYLRLGAYLESCDHRGVSCAPEGWGVHLGPGVYLVPRYPLGA